jgi:dihydroorotate dehydrogenase/Pyruvate/2-oxoacid:ferredoxin oxidoreductase delta subunit
MTEPTRQSTSPDLGVTLAGVRFRSPIGLAAIGGSSHFGKPDPSGDREDETRLRFILQNVANGSSCVYINISYLTETTLLKLLQGASPQPGSPPSEAWAQRFMKAVAPDAPYSLEGLYSTVSPGPGIPSIAVEEALLSSQKGLVHSLREKLPAGVPIIGGVIGCGGLPDAYVDAARVCEELGFHLIELNFHCPLQAGMRHGVDDSLGKRFPPFSQGGLMGEHADVVEEIVREVVSAVKTPVGAKFSAEVGFPRIVGMARRIRDAGAKYIHVGGAAVGIAPPDIYDRGKPLWPYMDGNAFCLTSGPWMRRVCYRDVAAVARFVPGLDIVASGGLMTPEHCIEAMMLGATLAQLCAGVMEQGRSLMRRSNRFLEEFLADQGYEGAQDLIGLSQPHIKFPEDIDMMAGKIVSQVDEDKCDRCGRCLNNLCIAISSDRGKVIVDKDRCTACGACTIACRSDALRLMPRT